MDKKIVLVGAGSTSFGPSMFSDLYLSDLLKGSTVVLHDINKDTLNIIYELLSIENERAGNKFKLEQTLDREAALKNADFVINSIEVGNRMELWWQDYKIPRKHGSTQILGECGGPGGTFHAFRIIPPIVEIAQDMDKLCPNAFLINFSNPMSRVCLAIKRSSNIKFVGLCHQIQFLEKDIPKMLDKKIEDLKMVVAGLNHFGFLLDLKDKDTNNDLMPEFNEKALSFYKEHEDPFEFSSLSFEVFKRFGYFPHPGDNHLGEYLQFGEEFTKTQDMIDWINRTDKYNEGIFKRVRRYHRRLKKGRYPRKGMLYKVSSGEQAVPIIEALIEDKNTYENSVNIPNDGIIENLPKDLVVEVPARVNKQGIHGIKLGNIPKNIAALLRIEATVQDLCVEAILKRSKKLAIASLAIDPNLGSFEKAEKIYDEMIEKQSDYLPKFK
ncbi:MAG: alpha-glucosidase/alpha-galactosidase [Candidatus Lokiarchaeota archaeon]|nr:alpha-glucosidase/alpha-galactosidase [Candidatus Lokiarchaeota archaeon]MBD3201682.1 alpha-glucosidase/alpha-galactosidase [Candidatus Lokiarchaeota archaeon]